MPALTHIVFVLGEWKRWWPSRTRCRPKENDGNCLAWTYRNHGMLLLKVRAFRYELRPIWHKISMRERKETQRASAESPRERRSPRAHICEKSSLCPPRIVIFFTLFSLSQTNVNELYWVVYLNKHSLDFKMHRRVRAPLTPDLRRLTCLKSL